MARKFFHVCVGMFLLALSYHLGASTASAQFGQGVVGVTDASSGLIVLTANGDAYYHLYYGNTAGNGHLDPSGPVLMGNFWAGGPTPALHESWGSLKSRYAPNGGTVSKSADTR